MNELATDFKRGASGQIKDLTVTFHAGVIGWKDRIEQKCKRIGKECEQ